MTIDDETLPAFAPVLRTRPRMPERWPALDRMLAGIDRGIPGPRIRQDVQRAAETRELYGPVDSEGGEVD